MKIDKKWMRRWLSLLLVLAMLFGDMQGVVSVSARELEPEATTEETIEVEEEETTEEPSVPEESTDESTEEPSVSEESTGESNDASEDENQPEETRPEEVVQFLADVEALRAKVEQLKQLRQLLSVSAVSVMDTMDEDFIEVEPEEGEQPEEAEPAEGTSEVPALTEEERQTLQSELNALTDEVSQEFGRLCLAYYGSMERIPFFQTEEEPEEVTEETEEPSDEIPEAEEIADIRSLLTEEEQQETERFLKELVGLLYGIQLLDETPETKKIFNIEEGQYGSGSRNLNKNDDHHRFFLEYMVDTKTSAGVIRKNTFSVLVKKGEYLCFGSSIAQSTFITSVEGKDKEIELIVGEEHTYFDNTKDGKGYIKNRTQEINGPRLTQSEVDGNDTTRYEPHIWYNSTDEAQVVTLIFYAKSQKVSLGTYIKAGDPFEDKQGESTIAAWDITVVGLKNDSRDEYEVKPGRAWCKYLALTTNGNSVAQADLELHVLTDDNYTYKVNLNQISPFGFIFFANNMGFTHSGNGYDQSIYHSFASNNVDLASMKTQGITIHDPAAPDSGHLKTYNVFFNEPSQDVKKYLEISQKEIQEITKIAFNGVSDGISQHQHGGDFSFEVHGATSVSLTIDFSKTLIAMQAVSSHDVSVDEYLEKYKDKDGTSYKPGMGIVELNTAVSQDGINTIHWDGKDIHGHYLPIGYYATKDGGDETKIQIKVQAKGGEIHFPMIDVEGLNGGITIERLGSDTDEHRFDIYYNNNPLKTFTYDGSQAGSKQAITNPQNSYGTVFYPITNHTYTYNTSNAQYFNNLGKPSTLQSDGFTHIGHDSREPNILFRASGNDGGGNNSALDIWTYYTPETTQEVKLTTDFAIVDNPSTGEIKGNIFYDAPNDSSVPNGQKDSGESGISGLRVRLVHADGSPVVHTIPVPVFDEFGNFKWDDDGNILEIEKEVEFTALTDVQGNYRLTGVYWGKGEDIAYYVQVELNEVQRKTLKYVCTTAQQVKTAMKWGYEVGTGYGGDGNELKIPADVGSDLTKISYADLVTDPDDQREYPKFDMAYAKPIIVSTANANLTATAPSIGYISAIPKAQQESLTVKKVWGENGTDNPSVPEVIVELYVSEDVGVESTRTDGQGVNQRHGRLLETVVLKQDSDSAKNWTYTWPVLDNSKQYFLIEYYYQVKEKHHHAGIEQEDEQEQNHQVLIGATDVIFCSSTGAGMKPYFGDNLTQPWHPDASDEHEKQTTIDTDALLFKMTYQLEKDGTKNTITLKNVQTYDERAYYLWAGKETVLPNFIGMTRLKDDGSVMEFVPENLEAKSDSDNTIKDLSVFWVDGPGWTEAKKTENVASQFKLVNGEVVVSGTDGTDKPKPGTYTFEASYKGAKWTLTFHIYDVQPDGVFHYSPLSTKEHVLVGTEEDADGIEVQRDWLFANDDYRIQLRQDAVDRSMGTCADLVAIGFADSPVDDISNIEFKELNLMNNSIPYTPNDGSGVALEINVSKSRQDHTNREEDHVQYTSVSYTPVRGANNEYSKAPVCVYYKYVILSESAVHSKDDTTNTTNQSRLINNNTDSSRGVEMYTYFVLQPIVAEMTGATMSVGETIDLNFYMDEDPAETHAIEEYCMDFIVDGVVTDGLGNIGQYQHWQSGTNLYQQREDSVLGKIVNMYGFTFRDLNAYQMGETVTGRLWMHSMGREETAEGDYILIDERDFSVKQYAYSMLKSGSGARAELQNMLVDMLNYGSEALRYAVDKRWIVDPGINLPSEADNGSAASTIAHILPNSILGVNLKNRHLNVTIPDAEKMVQNTASTNVTSVAVGLTMLEGMQMSLRLQFMLNTDDWKEYSVDLVYPDDSTETIPSDRFILNGGRQFNVYTKGISPFYWTTGETLNKDGRKGDGKFALTIKNGTSIVYQVEYGVGTYCQNMQDDTSLGSMVKAIYKYGTTAKQWLNTNPTYKDDIYGSATTIPTTAPTVPTETDVPTSETSGGSAPAA